MRFTSVIAVVMLAMICSTVEGAEKQLMDVINVCKRSDPDLSNCYCTNWNNVMPRLKDGAPEMSIMPLDPILVKNVDFSFGQAHSVRLELHLQNVRIAGMSQARARSCALSPTSNGMQMYMDIYIPNVAIRAAYKGVGYFLLIGMVSSGDFQVEIAGVRIQAVWKSTSYMKNNRQHLFFTGNMLDTTMGKVAAHLSDMFGNNTVLNEQINHAINENIDDMYNEMRPILSKTTRRMLLKVANDFYGTFSYDLRFSEE